MPLVIQRNAHEYARQMAGLPRWLPEWACRQSLRYCNDHARWHHSGSVTFWNQGGLAHRALVRGDGKVLVHDGPRWTEHGAPDTASIVDGYLVEK